jgi:hypothetical protein
MLSPEVGPRDDSEYIGKASGLVRTTGGRDLSYKDAQAGIAGTIRGREGAR